MIRQTLAALAAFASSSGAVFGQAEVSTTLTPTAVTQYIYRGERLGGPSFQPQVEADRGDFGAGLWTNVPLVEETPGRSKPELDPYLYYKIPISGSVDVVPGFQLYDYPNDSTADGLFRSRAEFNLALDYRFEGFVVTPKVYYDATLRGTTGELSGAYAIPLKSLGTEIDLAGTAGEFRYDNAVNHAPGGVREFGGYWSSGASLPFRLPSGARITLGFSYGQGFRQHFQDDERAVSDYRNPLQASRGVLSVAYSRTF